MVCCSAVVHLIVYFFLIEFHFSAHFKEAPVYYVDILDLPVANPQAGSPAQAEGTPTPPPPAVPAKREMIIPAQPPVGLKPAPPQKKPEAETAREFEKRIAQMEREAAARNQAAAIEALRKKVAARGPVGIPGGTGTEAGSDYASYIRSRLEDEFKTTIAFQTKNPELLVKLVISQNGRIIRQQIIKSSRDKLFEDSVSRAIAKAEKNFRPPPGGNQFEIEVKFSPQGIGKK
jgi:colicin import membrane protein